MYVNDVHPFEDVRTNLFPTFMYSKASSRAAQQKEPHKNSKTFCGDPGFAQAVTPPVQIRVSGA